MLSDSRIPSFTALVILAIAATGAAPVQATDWSPHAHDYVEHVGSWAHGPCNAVAVEGDLLLYGDGPTLHCLRLATDGTATELATLTLDVAIAAIAIGDGVAYVACEFGGRPLYTIRIVNPDRPYVTHRIEDGGLIRDLHVEGSWLFAAAARLKVYDLADPRRPVEAAVADVGYAAAVTVIDDLAYVCVGDEGLAVVRVTDPANPELVTHVLADEPVYFRDVEALDGYLAVADTESGFRTFDLADPLAPLAVGNAWGHGLAWLAVDGHHVFGAAQLGSLYAYDCADPENPVLVDEIGYEWSEGLAVRPAQVFQAAADGGLRVYDATDPASLIWSWNGAASDEAVAVDLHGDLLGVAAERAGFIVVDVADSRRPVELGRCEFPGGVARSVAMSGDLAFVGANFYYYHERLYALDLAQPEQPTIRGWAVIGDDVRGIDVAGDLVYAASAEAGLQIVDAGDPDNLAVVGGVAGFGNAIAVTVQGAWAYVAAGFEGLAIIDVSDPANPMVAATVPTPDSCTRVDVVGDFAYLGVPDVGLMTIDVSFPAAPQVVSQLNLPWANNCHGLAVRDGLAYLTGNSSPLLRVVDVADPAQPAVVAEVDPPGYSRGCVAGEHHLYVACHDYGVMVFARHGARGEPEAAASGLAQHCAPNPCRHETWISFELPRADLVSVEVYDLAGRRVARPWRGALAAGRQEVRWNGRSGHGSPLASGIYVYRIETSTHRAVGKIQLLR